jgi:hypothetical protein
LTPGGLDRRILCDRILPTCLQCSRSKRICKGYGIRLSWPSANDGRRAVVLKEGLQRAQSRPIADSRLVHMSSWDIEMHWHVTASTPNSKPVIHLAMELFRGRRLTLAIAYIRPLLLVPMQWNPATLKVGDKDLLEYCTFIRQYSISRLTSS